jgi:hypothetical protein
MIFPPPRKVADQPDGILPIVRSIVSGVFATESLIDKFTDSPNSVTMLGYWVEMVKFWASSCANTTFGLKIIVMRSEQKTNKYTMARFILTSFEQRNSPYLLVFNSLPNVYLIRKYKKNIRDR